MIPSTHPRRYSFVTIGFEGDAGLLQLQARSMRMNCPPELIEQIIIVDNSSIGSRSKWVDELVYQYGDLARFLRILPAADISTMPSETHGWFTQQVLKLEVASFVLSERYVILDAKNHLFARLDREFLETSTDQLRMTGRSYVDHPMQEFLERTLAYLDIDPRAHLNWFTRTETPFTMLTSEARDLVKHLAQKEARSFASVFLDRKLSEFFLYSGFLLSKGTLWQSYELSNVPEAQIWPGNADEQGCNNAIRIASQNGYPFMTIHRQAVEKLDQNARRLIAEFWYERGLFPTANDGIRFLRNPNRSRQTFDGHVTSRPVSALVSRFSSYLRRPN